MLERIEVGKILKPKGIHGALKITLDLDIENEIKPNQFLFIDLDGNQVPFKITEVELANELLIYFKDVSNLEMAKDLSGKTISIDKSVLSKASLKKINKQQELVGLDGYLLVDENTKIAVEIIYLEEFPSGLMAQCLYQGRELWIPIEETWIVELDHTKKVIVLQLPEGLFDL